MKTIKKIVSSNFAFILLFASILVPISAIAGKPGPSPSYATTEDLQQEATMRGDEDSRLQSQIDVIKTQISGLQSQVNMLQNEVNGLGQPPTYSLGDVLEDQAVVFYVDHSGHNGLAARSQDESYPLTWAEAKQTAESHGPGWRLPTRSELDLLYEQKNIVGNFTNANDWYWSSTEYDISSAWRENLVTGNQNQNDKNDYHKVRAVRAF